MLYLIRHADAAAGEMDAERPLTAKGRNQVARLGRFLKAAGIGQPQEVWHSPLARAQETAELLAQGLKLSAPLVLTSGLRPNDDPAPIAAAVAQGAAAHGAKTHGAKPTSSRLNVLSRARASAS